MKKKMFMGMAAALVALSATAGNYKVSGSIKGIADGTQVVLVPVTHDDEKPIAEATVQNGKFAIQGTVSEPICVSLRIKDTYGGVQLMVDNENATVTATAQKSGRSDIDYYEYTDKKVTGSPLTDKLYQLTAVRDSLNEVRMAFEKRYSELNKKLGEAYNAKDQAKIKELKESDEYKAMGKEDNEFFYAVSNAYTSRMIANKDTYWGPLLMVNFTSYLSPDMRSTFEQFSDAAKNSYYGKKAKDELYPAGGVGQKVPEFSVTDEAGKTHTLASLLKGKKYLLLDFWASWCGPCRREIPNVKKQYELYKSKGLEVVSISIDKKAADWKKAVKDENLQWPNFLSPDVATQYKVRAVPTMYLLDSEGRIVAENDEARGEKLAAKLAELFK